MEPSAPSGSGEPEQVCAIKRLQDERSISAQVAVKEPKSPVAVAMLPRQASPSR